MPNEVPICLRRKELLAPSQPSAREPTRNERGRPGSPAFSARFCTQLNGTLDADVAAQLTQTGRDIGETVCQELTIAGPADVVLHVRAEFFYNQHNILILGLLTPAS